VFFLSQASKNKTSLTTFIALCNLKKFNAGAFWMLPESRKRGSAAMARVTVKITPSLAGALNASACEWLLFEKDIADAATIGDLFKDMASTDHDFGTVIFNPQSGKLNDLVVVVLNNQLLQPSDIMEAKLSDGDALILLPVYLGG
jgi:hypothetical protein